MDKTERLQNYIGPDSSGYHASPRRTWVISEILNTDFLIPEGSESIIARNSPWMREMSSVREALESPRFTLQMPNGQCGSGPLAPLFLRSW